jgi:hypothetical protein
MLDAPGWRRAARLTADELPGYPFRSLVWTSQAGEVSVYVHWVLAHQAFVDRRFLGGCVDTRQERRESGFAGVQAVIVLQGDQPRQPQAQRLGWSSGCGRPR